MFLHDVNFWVKGKFLHINKVSLSQIYTLYSPWSSILKIHYQECPLISSCSVAKLCLTLRDPLDCSPWGPFSLWDFSGKDTGVDAFSSSRGSSRPQNGTCVSSGSCIDRQILYHWATWETTIHDLILWLLYFGYPEAIFCSWVYTVW